MTGTYDRDLSDTARFLDQINRPGYALDLLRWVAEHSTGLPVPYAPTEVDQ
ncbi:hypothetical protein [Corynebacterium variabile]|uniref:Uncharacterized protein n=1 Tax=Corynebacterium variabile TaxID=1727 RepID=A0A4Y4C6U7_9CORY|nr:hypothetical protein [Corynebacterium variabile]GEC87579.1 hypothetical protein CVA01_28930 [Corynebacterium variabile]